ncbi:hypothetical protein GCM10025771_00530 [Niveibacterium umoris]|uniref:Uncharacterized protein n=1 Tax=Niveibacterium umoris TaxID=1193620 RepID=A0A840BX57_9RHOO|nr:hypothetical protein [Niveibacterium umoris]MBB4014887.1 hypothetical protein [Niveibacterium umoris]
MFTILALLTVAAAYPTWKAFQDAKAGKFDQPVHRRPNYYV